MARKRKKKGALVKLQTTIWALCKKIIRHRYPNICYTCGAENLQGNNWQTGHMFSKSSLNAYLKYDLRNLRPQCFKCNMKMEGRGAMFYRFLVEREGQEFVDKLYEDTKVKLKQGKETKEFYTQLIEEYKQIIKDECKKSSISTKTSKTRSKKQ